MRQTNSSIKKPRFLFGLALCLAAQNAAACLPPLIGPTFEYSTVGKTVWVKFKDNQYAHEGAGKTTLDPKKLQVLQARDYLRPKAFAKDNRSAYLNGLSLQGAFDFATLEPISFTASGEFFEWVVFRDKRHWYFMSSDANVQGALHLEAFADAQASPSFEVALSPDGHVLYLTDHAADARYSVRRDGKSFTRWPGKASEWKEGAHHTYVYQQNVYVQSSGFFNSVWGGLQFAGAQDEVQVIGFLETLVSACGSPTYKTMYPIYKAQGKIYVSDGRSKELSADESPQTTDAAVTLDYIKRKHKLVPVPDALKNSPAGDSAMLRGGVMFREWANVIIGDQKTELYSESVVNNALNNKNRR